MSLLPKLNLLVIKVIASHNWDSKARFLCAQDNEKQPFHHFLSYACWSRLLILANKVVYRSKCILSVIANFYDKFIPGYYLDIQLIFLKVQSIWCYIWCFGTFDRPMATKNFTNRPIKECSKGAFAASPWPHPKLLLTA